MIELYRRLADDPTLECQEEVGRSRSKIARLHNSAGQRFFAKQFNPEAGTAQNSIDHLKGLIMNDLAGLMFLNELSATRGLVPELVGGDAENCVILMKDIGEGVQLDELLRGSDDASASDGLCSLMSSLAVLHGTTIGHAERYRSIRGGLGHFSEEDEADASFPNYREFVERISDRLGLETPAELLKEICFVLEEMFRPGPLFGYCHRDPCPDNCRLVGAQMKIYDFEMGAYANVLFDAVYPVIRFPTCWCVGEIPDRTVQRAERVYRETLAQWVPQIAEDTYYLRGRAIAVAYWLMRSAKWQLEQALDADRSWGLATVRQRFITRSRIALELLEKEAILPALAGWLGSVFEAAEKGWDCSRLPLYPAFTSKI